MPILTKIPDNADKSKTFSATTNILKYMSHVMRKPVLPCANNKGSDQPAHPHSLISAFVVRCLDSIISLVSISEI